MQSSSDIGKRQGILVELVTPGLDAREVEDLVDQVEQMLAGTVDVADIFLVAGILDRAEHLARHHLGEAQNCIERRSQFMAHRGKETGLGEIGFLGAAAGFIGDGLGDLQFGDEVILLGLDS
jgi:hypothetical protein